MTEYLPIMQDNDNKLDIHDSDFRKTTAASPEPARDFRINISVFEGPIDLLLYLIRKNELDIHEISLARIAKEYLDYVEIIKLIDLEMAGDFIVIASTLMKIKARSLFSREGNDEEATEGDEVKNELIRYLLEYQKLGGVAEKLAEKEASRLGIFPRGGEKQRIGDSIPQGEQAPEYMLFDLLTALRDILAAAPKTETHEVELLNITSEMKQQEIMEIIKSHGKVDFIDLVNGQPRLIIVLIFIAMLELIKKRLIRIRQSKQFGRIVLYERSDNTDQDN
ncbi:segregation/condensation protein A [bacterium]|nr:segregation/condensation protein A [bacterium]